MPQPRIDPIFGKETPILFAHRGGAMEVAESTRKGFRHAISVEADVLELDVRALDMDKDGRQRELVVWHGPELSNVRIGFFRDARATRPGERNEEENDIRHWNWEDLKGKAWVADPYVWHYENGKKKPKCKIDLKDVSENDSSRLLMTLSEFLEEFPDSHLNIEMKDSFRLDDEHNDVKRFVELLRADRGRHERTILVVSLDESLMDEFRQLTMDDYPPFATGLSMLGVLWSTFKGYLPWVHNKKLDDVALQTSHACYLSPRWVIDDIHAAGGAVHVFLTNFPILAGPIDEEEGRPTRDELFKILNRGVDGIMTDRPKHVHKLIEEWKEGKKSHTSQ